MLYISGQKDTLKDLMQNEGFAGSYAEYEQKFTQMNPQLCLRHPDYKRQLPAHMPICLVLDLPVDALTQAETIAGLMQFSLEERKQLKMMQDNLYDVPTQIALTDVMEELQTYAKGFRKWLKTPLIVTPWTEMNNTLTDKSLFKIFGETAKYNGDLIKGSTRFNTLDKLYENMMARDALNRQFHMLKKQFGSKSTPAMKDLEKQIADLTKLIKADLPKKISTKMSKYVHSRFTQSELIKMRANSFSVKGARQGHFPRTNLDVLNRSGLARLRTMIKGLKGVGQTVGKGATVLNYAVVAYDSVEAYNNGNTKAAARTFITGLTATYLTSQAVTAAGGTFALGGYVVGALAGDATLGATLLICSPVLGWVVLIVGIAAAGYIAYKSKGALEGVWDICEEYSGYYYKVASQFANDFHEEVKSAWSSGSRWVLDFYGN